jgi:hypothetical protein
LAEIFPKWANRVPAYLAGGAAVLLLATVAGVWYFFSPEYTHVGYMPRQPVPFSHELHAGELEIDCRYCHTRVEVSAVATVPPTEACMTCHRVVARDSEDLAPIIESFTTGRRMRWVRVHKVPEYAYFDHSVHIRAGIGCFSCHGDVAAMEELRQVHTLSMSWCLDCHRNPDPHIRPPEQITNMAWIPPPDQPEFARELRREREIGTPTDCTACHR